MPQRRAARLGVEHHDGGEGCRTRAGRDDDGAIVLVVDDDLGEEGALCGRADQPDVDARVAEPVAVVDADAEEGGDGSQGEEGAEEEAKEIAHGMPCRNGLNKSDPIC
ncbi:hypothetical protein GCM10022288_04980 [Gryllotalpicola kribbensis]|uniref:Uncharacterized protein n=1 Tax=Gryllotalpicola kribbensis TaxID=993084 RepID=A0ABP8AI18_9MICO